MSSNYNNGKDLVQKHENNYKNEKLDNIDLLEIIFNNLQVLIFF